MKIKTYLINLASSDDRLQTANEQLQNAKIAFERVEAFDGRNTDPLTVDKYDDKAARRHMGRSLNGGELGCYFSHVRCVERFLQSDADYAVVLEDDMTCQPDLHEKITAILDFLAAQNQTWYLINIGARKNKIASKLQSFSGHTLYRSHYFAMLTTGLIWSRQGAEKFIEIYQKQAIYCPIDNYFRDWLTTNNKGLSVVPALTPAGEAASEIDKSTANRCHTSRETWYGLIKQRRLWLHKIIALKHKLFSCDKS